jgi:hypothetical protein
MIFLDLLRSKYIGIGGPQISALSDMILGTAAAGGLPIQASDTALLGKCLRRLRQQQLLSNAPALEPTKRSPVLDTPAATWAVDAPDRQVSFEWGQLLRLWRSTFIASAWLRRRSLGDIAERLAALRARRPKRQHEVPTDAMRASVESYMRLRPFALSASDRCLNDSLTLVHFLTTQGLFARWVIGVRVNPFGAHSWAQVGDIVLNDYPERVRHFQPILIV